MYTSRFAWFQFFFHKKQNQLLQISHIRQHNPMRSSARLHPRTDLVKRAEVELHFNDRRAVIGFCCTFLSFGQIGRFKNYPTLNHENHCVHCTTASEAAAAAWWPVW